MPRLAVMIRRELPPAEVARFAAASEALGLDEVWVIEDCFYTSGVANAALALAATERAHVGIGILPAVLRNGALAAMEVATLAGAHRGRLTAGFGPGVASWMRQVGAYPPSPLAALEATIGDVRALLHGATVRNERLDGVALEFPPDPVPAVLAAAGGPRGLQVADRAADGAILAEACPPAWAAAARRRLPRGGQLVVYAWLSAAADGDAARAALRPVVGEWMHRNRRAHALAAASFAPEVPPGAPLAEVPDAWIDELAVAGTPAECRASIGRLVAAGVDTVVLIPPLRHAAEQLALLR